MSSSISGKRSWHDNCRFWRCAVYRLDQAPEVLLRCLRLPQLRVVSPRMNHNSCNALIILQDRGYLRRNIKNTSTRETVRECTLPSANVARTCRTIESPRTQRRVPSRGEERSGFRWRSRRPWRGRDRRPGPGSRLPLLHPGSGVKDIWEDRVPGARGLCRETHGVEVVGVLAAGCILTPDLWASARDVSSIALRSLSWAWDLPLHSLQLHRIQLYELGTWLARFSFHSLTYNLPLFSVCLYEALSETRSLMTIY